MKVIFPPFIPNLPRAGSGVLLLVIHNINENMIDFDTIKTNISTQFCYNAD